VIDGPTARARIRSFSKTAISIAIGRCGTTPTQPTASSPKRSLTTFQLSRYLDYCSELLSLISKIGAIYVQEFPDPDALEAVDQLSNLTNGLTRNIWQKIMILDRAVEPR
jgi:hypothetical protein